MSRHSDNLERLCNKLNIRLGVDDSLYLQLRLELESYQAVEKQGIKPHDWSVPYQSFIKNCCDEILLDRLH